MELLNTEKLPLLDMPDRLQLAILRAKPRGLVEFHDGVGWYQSDEKSLDLTAIYRIRPGVAV